jgi:hypothetical protein
MSNNEFHASPILVYGPRKGGTTLLQSLLDGGSDVLMLPGELKLKWMPQRLNCAAESFLDFYLRRGRLDFPDLIERQNGAMSAKPDYHFASFSKEQTDVMFDAPRYVEQLSAMHTQPPASTREILTRDVDGFVAALRTDRKQFARWASKEVGADPQHVIGFWRKLFPEGKVVFLVRDPAFVVRSIIMDRRRKGIRLTFGRILRECREAQNIINSAHEYSIGREIMVSYEELTANTVAQMQRVAAQLQIPFEPVLCKPTTLGTPMVVRTSSRATQEVFQQAPSWKKDLRGNEILAISLYQKLAPAQHRLRSKKFIPYPQLKAALDTQA